jgi:oxygen-independent coproporphyrinogen-3 oxidase
LRPDGIGFYIHWPFCKAKCPYCDFNSHVAGAIDHAAWREALLAELDHVASRLGRRPLASIFFGGGTPSLMQPWVTAALIERAVLRFDPLPDLEITLEANPTSAERARLADFRSAGVNRLSIGIQALNDADLRFLGREHSAAEAIATLEHARSLFERFSFDLIYARPEQSLAGWTAELEQAIALAGDHLSLYQLTIEPGTRFFTLHQDGALKLPDDDLQADLFEFTRERLAAAGMPAYEVSNHARPGGACRHNLVYWQGRDSAGIGPGAHGRLTLEGQRVATRTARMPRAWLERVRQQGHGHLEDEPLGAEDRLVELLMMGLRLTEGVPIARLEAIGDRPLEQLLNAAALVDLEAEGFLSRSHGRLAATSLGQTRLNAILAALLDREPIFRPVDVGSLLAGKRSPAIEGRNQA